MEPFNFTIPYTEPYIPKALTFEVPERITVTGKIKKPLDEKAVIAILDKLKIEKVEAIGVCCLWSIVNPAHELAIGRLIEKHLPGVPYTLSHRINPSLREYRRASSTVIDASLKPVMGAYMRGLDQRLKEAGFNGRVLVVTSQGGVMDAEQVAETPVHLINSGPSMAPVAAFAYGAGAEAETLIVGDTGGTTFDVSLVRKGRIPRSRETWLGQPFRSHMTGMPSVDVKSIGAGGRLHRLGRCRRALACRTQKRRRRAGTGLLPAWRHETDGDRCRPRSGLPRCRLFPRRQDGPRS
jgi:N-methylhydantoinase A